MKRRKSEIDRKEEKRERGHHPRIQQHLTGHVSDVVRGGRARCPKSLFILHSLWLLASLPKEKHRLVCAVVHLESSQEFQKWVWGTRVVVLFRTRV